MIAYMKHMIVTMVTFQWSFPLDMSNAYFQLAPHHYLTEAVNTICALEITEPVIFFGTKLAVHLLAARVGLDCQKRSRSGLCSKLPDMRSVGDIALNPCFAKVKVTKVKECTASH